MAMDTSTASGSRAIRSSSRAVFNCSSEMVSSALSRPPRRKRRVLPGLRALRWLAELNT